MAFILDRRAVRDLDAIFDWIAKDNPAAADAVIERVLQSLELLTSFPEMGRIGDAPGTRELIVSGLPYLVIYEVRDRNDVFVRAIMHGAQDRR